MRAPYIPTENAPLSVCLGALIPFLMLVVSSGFPEGLRVAPILFSPFLCGFVAVLTFGAGERLTVRHCLTMASGAFLGLYGLLWISVIFSGFRPNSDLGSLVLVTTMFPPFLLVAVIVSMIGSSFGLLFALAIRR